MTRIREASTVVFAIGALVLLFTVIYQAADTDRGSGSFIVDVRN
jgi:hypothetical protein